MAVTGTVVYTYNVSSKDYISSGGGETKYSLTNKTGNFPSTPYAVTKAIIRYSKASVGNGTIYIYKETDGGSRTLLAEHGSYWTGYYEFNLNDLPKINTTNQSAIQNILKSIPNVHLFAEKNKHGGTMTAGSTIKITVTWKLTESASEFSVENQEVSRPGELYFGDTLVSTLETVGVGAVSHQIRFTVGEKVTEWVTAFENNTAGDEFEYEFAVNDWKNTIKDSTVGTIKVEVQTLADENRVIGTTEQTIPLKVPDSPEYYPSIDSQLFTIAAINPGEIGTNKFVQNVSRARVQVTSAAGAGAVVQSVTIMGRGINDDGTIQTPGASVVKQLDTSVLTVPGTETYTVAVTDSRGRSVSATKNITVLLYEPPSVQNFIVKRWDFTSETESRDSIRLKGSPVYTWREFTQEEGINNKLYMQFWYRRKGVESWIEVKEFGGQGQDPVPESSTVLDATHGVEVPPPAEAQSTGYAQDNAYEIMAVVYDTISGSGSPAGFYASVSSAEAFLYMNRRTKEIGVGAYPTGNQQLFVKWTTKIDNDLHVGDTGDSRMIYLNGEPLDVYIQSVIVDDQQIIDERINLGMDLLRLLLVQRLDPLPDLPQEVTS